MISRHPQDIEAGIAGTPASSICSGQFRNVSGLPVAERVMSIAAASLRRGLVYMWPIFLACIIVPWCIIVPVCIIIPWCIM